MGDPWYQKIAAPQICAGREITRIHREGVLTAGGPGGKSSERESTDALRRGEYVPEAELVSICLNCKRERCTGDCVKIKRAKREARERRKREKEGKQA